MAVLTAWGAPASSTPVAGAALEDIEERVARLLEDGPPESALVYLRTELEQASEPELKARILWISAWIELESGETSAADLDLREAARLTLHLPFPAVYGTELRDRWYAARVAVEHERERLAHDSVQRALAAFESGDRVRARELLERALEVVPDHPEARFDLGVLEMEEGRESEAISAFERVVAVAARQPDDVADTTLVLSLTNLGALYGSRGLPEESQRVLRRALEADPDHRPAWVHLGRSLRDAGQLEEARQSFERARGLEPADPIVADELARVLGRLGRWNQAAGLLVAATRDAPARPELWLHLGRAHQERGDVDGAREAFREALRLDPANASGQGASAALHLAALEWRAGQTMASSAAAARATDLDPTSSTAWIYRGLGHESLGALPEARAAFETALELDGRRAEAWANLGRVALQLGDGIASAEAYERALALNPDLPGLQEGLEQARSGASFRAGSGTGRSTPPPVTRPRLGLRIADIDYGALGLTGILVASVDPGSAAERAGLRADDLLIRADGRPLGSLDDLLDVVRQMRGTGVSIDLLRDQRPLTVRLVP